MLIESIFQNNKFFYDDNWEENDLQKELKK